MVSLFLVLIHLWLSRISGIETRNCNLPIVQHLHAGAAEDFQAYKGHSPVLITDGMREWLATKWTKAYFESKFGDIHVKVS